MKVELGLDRIADLDGGKVATAFNLALRRLVTDCLDRSGDARPRKLTLAMEIVPETEDGICVGVTGEFEIDAKEPTRRSKKYALEVHPSGKIMTNDRPDRKPEPTFAELSDAMDEGNKKT